MLLLASCQSPTAPDVADLAITGVTVIDASGSRQNQTVVVEGGIVSAVQAVAEGPYPAKQVIDGRGRFLIPGLWDMHVHITYEPALTELMPDLFLSYGITSVRDTGALLHEIAPEVARWRAPGAVAPRLFYSGPLLDGGKVVYDGDSRPEIGVGNPDVGTARARVAGLKDSGVDFVKIYELVSPEVFAALVAAAREAGLPIASHVPLSVSVEEAGPQVDSMEHLRNIELGCAETAVVQLDERRARLEQPGAISGYDLRRGLHAEHHARARMAIDQATCDRVIASLASTIQVPTLRLNTFAVHPAFTRDGWADHLDRFPAALRSSWHAAAQGWAARAASMDPSAARWSLDLVKMLHDAGVPIGAGTDTPIGSAIPGYSLHSELEILVAAGLTPLEAIVAATVRPAEFFALRG